MLPIALGFRALRGGSVVVAVTTEGRAPRVVLSTFLATAAEGDRLSLEPYHVAAEMAREARGRIPPEAVAAVADGRKRQEKLAVKNLTGIIRTLEKDRYKVAAAALLVNRAGWITDLLEHSLSSPEHPPVIEGLAVREALRYALGKSGIKTIEMDEKSLLQAASAELRLPEANIDARLKELGASVGKPWRKEQKLACLSAWVAVTASVK